MTLSPLYRSTQSEPSIFRPLLNVLYAGYYMHLADLHAYLEADGRLVDLYRKPEAWAHKACPVA